MSDTLVLGYHAVSPTWPSRLSVTPAALERQVRYLLDRGYRGVTFTEVVRGAAPARAFALTFDDAYRSVHRNALSMLAELGVPGTVFVPTDYAGTEEPMCWPGIDDWMGGPHEAELVPMSWAELSELQQAGWEIGSHTRSHPRLTEIDDAALDEELAASRLVCEERLDGECASFAYPYGAYDDRVVAAVRRAGYSSACTLPARLTEPEPLAWPRVGIYPADEKGWRWWAKVARPIRMLRASALWEAPARLRDLARGGGPPPERG